MTSASALAQHDVPIYLTGVGTVIAYNTVIIRSQIQGQIVSICGVHRLSLRDHSQGLISPAGYRIDHQPVRGGAGYFLSRPWPAQQALLNAAMRDPAVASIGSAVGAGVVERVVDRVGQDAVARGDIALDRDVEHTDVTTDQFNAEPFSSSPTTNVTRSTR